MYRMANCILVRCHFFARSFSFNIKYDRERCTFDQITMSNKEMCVFQAGLLAPVHTVVILAVNGRFEFRLRKERDFTKANRGFFQICEKNAKQAQGI